MYALVTGGTDGMGLLAATKLCEMNYNVTITARSDEKGYEAIKYIKGRVHDAKVNVLILDLSHLSTIREFCSNYLDYNNNALHLLVNNAGILVSEGYSMTKTVDGLELHFQVNHLGHFLLTSLLLPILFKAGGARVLNVSSKMHMIYNESFDNVVDNVQNESNLNNDGWMCYSRSKMANILFTRYLAHKFPLETYHITFNALTPGLVNTKMIPATNTSLKHRSKSIEEGIQCAMYLSTSPEVEGITGKYFSDDCKEATSPDCISAFVQSDVEAEYLWRGSLLLCGMRDDEYGS